MKRPSRALVAVRRPAINSRSLSPIRPNSSAIEKSNPLEWPADLSAERNSAVEPFSVCTKPGEGDFLKSSPCKCDALEISSICRSSSADFSRVTLTVPIRIPGRFSGPASSASARTADNRGFCRFSLREHSKLSLCVSASRDEVEPRRKAASIGSPPFGWPGGTTRHSRDQRATACAGSAGKGGGALAAMGFSAFSRARRLRWRSLAASLSAVLSL